MSPDELLIWFNNQFPLDRQWRKKHNIAFGSKQHRETSQIEIFLDIREDKLYELHSKQYLKEKENLEKYNKTGEWLKASELGEKEFDNLFDNLKI